jgi:uncharacterized membrane protein YedE/YeeE
MLIFGVLAFAIVIFFLSFMLGKQNGLDHGKIATYLTLIAWGSLMFGLYIGRTM